MRRIILFSLITVLVASGAGYFFYNQHQMKGALIQEVFGPQFDQVRHISSQMTETFSITAASQGATPPQQEEGLAIIDAAQEEMHAALQTLLAETYTPAELAEKKSFEQSAFASELRQQERQTLRAMHVLGKRVGREAIMLSIGKEFSENEVTTLRGLITGLQGDAQTPNEDRVHHVAEKMQMDPQQASLLVMLLALSKEDAALEQSLNLTTIDRGSEAYKRAETYITLTKLDQVFADAIGQVLAQDDLAAAYTTAQQDLAAFVATHYAPTLLEQANTYFSTPQAQAILEKDVHVATALPEIITKIIDRTHTALEEIFILEGVDEEPSEGQNKALNNEEANPVETPETTAEEGEEQTEEQADLPLGQPVQGAE